MPRTPANLDGKMVFIIGGSKGLGKEMAKVYAGQGAHVTIFSRDQSQLDKARVEMVSCRKSEDQQVVAISTDMGIASEAHLVLSAQLRLPDIVYCVAGGTPNECGYLLDLGPEIFERAMNNNYYSSLYPAQAILKLWTEDDKRQDVEAPPTPKERKIVFVNSSASLVPAPGYLAYSAAKAAQRSLADTLRLEAMRYSGPKSTYTVQCVFAHNFITETFLQEQKNKPDLTKRIEGTTGDLAALEKDFPYAEKIAPEIVAAVASGDYAVCDKRLDPQLLWANASGASPKRGWGIVDTLMAILMCFVFPFVRRDMEKKAWGDALKGKVDKNE